MKNIFAFILAIPLLVGGLIASAATPSGAVAPASTAPAVKVPVLTEKEKKSPALDAKGNIRPDWRGLATQSAYEARGADGKWVKRTWISRRGAGAGVTTTAQVYSPPNPEDGGSYVNYAGSFPFSPAINDITLLHDSRQGQFDNCWALGAMASLYARPDLRARLLTIAPNGVDVHLFDYSDTPATIRMTFDLSTRAEQPNPATGATWIPYVGKALAFWRYQAGLGTSPNLFSTTNGGFPGEMFELMGYNVKALIPSNADFPTVVRAALAAHKPMAWCTTTNFTGAPIIEHHCYVIVGCEPNAANTDYNFTIYNVWGVDGAGNDGKDDGLVQVAWKVIQLGGTVAMAEVPDLQPIAGDGNADGIITSIDRQIWLDHIGPADVWGDVPPWSIGNYKPDPFVDLADFDVWESAWKKGGKQP